MSFIPILQYLGGLAAFGFMYWIMDGVITAISGVGFHQTGDVYTLYNYFWSAIIVVYLIFGGYWVVRTYNEQEYMVR